jgi:hypothetical protein
MSDLLFYVGAAGEGTERLVLREASGQALGETYRGAVDLFETVAGRSRETGAKVRVSPVGAVSPRQESEIRAVGRMLATIGLHAR